MTQRELADAVGVTRAAVFQWEGSGSGKPTSPSVENVEKIAGALGVSMAVFFGDIPKKRKAS